MILSTLLIVSGALIAAGRLIPEPATVPITSDMIQGGALISMTWVIWYLLARTFPAHLKAMKDQRDAFLNHLKEKERE